MKIPKVILRIETSRACGRGILLGISKYCHLFSHWRLSQKLPFYLYSDISVDNPNLPENWMADGMIIAQSDIPEFVRQIGVPIIGIDVLEPVFGMANIIGDNDEIAAMALKHFIDRGFSQLAYCQFADIRWAVERGASFASYAKDRGIDVFRYEIKGTERNFSWEDELYMIGTWLKSLPHSLGLFACNDDCGKLVSVACQSAGIIVPDDVAILGVDNDEMICLPNDPPLSSIALDFENAGFQAASLLDKIMKGEDKSASQRIVLHSINVEIRQSTDTFAVSDPEVALALRFIRDNSRRAICVPDVVDKVCMSRRGLEYRFKAVLSRSINKVIRELRTEQVSAMLIETNLSISQIAYKLGFTDIEHISRYFRSNKEITPTEFRKKYGNL